MASNSLFTVGVLHPGAMGSTIASSLMLHHNPIYCSEGRSQDSIQRALLHNIPDAHTLHNVVLQSDIIISVCPPHGAESVAERVSLLGFKGVFVDANAVSPQTTRRMMETMEKNGCEKGKFVDGCIIGPPATKKGTTRLYLSGKLAPTVANCFMDSNVEAIVMADRPVGDASALKMAYAGYSKASNALLCLSLALAQNYGIKDDLLNEWGKSRPDLFKQHQQIVASSAQKSWRWIAEMEEIASTMKGAGLPDGFHLAAAEVWQRLSEAIGENRNKEVEDVSDLLEKMLKNASFKKE